MNLSEVGVGSLRGEPEEEAREEVAEEGTRGGMAWRSKGGGG